MSIFELKYVEQEAINYVASLAITNQYSLKALQLNSKLNLQLNYIFQI